MKLVPRWAYLSSLIIFLIGCSESSTKTEKANFLNPGKWIWEMDLGNNNLLPFEMEVNQNEGNYSFTIVNHEERIVIDSIEQKNDSLILRLPIFESEFLLKRVSKDSLTGVWRNYYKGKDYLIPVTASMSRANRFANVNNKFNLNFSGKYEVVFSPNQPDSTRAIGLFNQSGNKITGTFATETGDYRHLAGNVSGNKIMLSTFDGSHAFLFTAEKTETEFVGTFYSGTHWKEPWVASLNDSATLRDPNQLTYLKEGFTEFSFAFPNSKGDTIRLNDAEFQNKVVIVQIMGSWCPNCLDETRYLTSLYKKYKNKGLEVIALAFERTSSYEKALANLERMKSKTGADYTFLLGGATRKDKAEEKLPMLNHIMSYPTAIFVDKEGKVRRIHTGFYGPSTGTYYADFVSETEGFVNQLLKE